MSCIPDWICFLHSVQQFLNYCKISDKFQGLFFMLSKRPWQWTELFFSGSQRPSPKTQWLMDHWTPVGTIQEKIIKRKKAWTVTNASKFCYVRPCMVPNYLPPMPLQCYDSNIPRGFKLNRKMQTLLPLKIIRFFLEKIFKKIFDMHLDLMDNVCVWK